MLHHPLWFGLQYILSCIYLCSKFSLLFPSEHFGAVSDYSRFCPPSCMCQFFLSGPIQVLFEWSHLAVIPESNYMSRNLSFSRSSIRLVHCQDSSPLFLYFIIYVSFKYFSFTILTHQLSSSAIIFHINFICKTLFTAFHIPTPSYFFGLHILSQPMIREWFLSLFQKKKHLSVWPSSLWMDRC